MDESLLVGGGRGGGGPEAELVGSDEAVAHFLRGGACVDGTGPLRLAELLSPLAGGNAGVRGGKGFVVGGGGEAVGAGGTGGGTVVGWTERDGESEREKRSEKEQSERDDRERERWAHRERGAHSSMNSPPSRREREWEREGTVAREGGREGRRGARLGEGGEGRRDGEDSLRQVAVAEQEDGGGGSASAARGLGEWDISGSGGASGTAADVGGGAGGGMWGHGSNGPLGFAGAQCKVLQRLGRSVFVVHQVAPGGRTDFVSAQHPGVSLAAGVGVFSRALRAPLHAGDSVKPVHARRCSSTRTSTCRQGLSWSSLRVLRTRWRHHRPGRMQQGPRLWCAEGTCTCAHFCSCGATHHPAYLRGSPCLHTAPILQNSQRLARCSALRVPMKSRVEGAKLAAERPTVRAQEIG